MNDFVTDDDWQRAKHDEILVPLFYERHYPGRYRSATEEEQTQGIDMMVRRQDGSWASIDEKIVAWPGHIYEAFSLETKSCTLEGHERDGWMTTGSALYLLYCFTQASGGLDVWLIDFPALKSWFWKRPQQFGLFQMDSRNRTRGRVVPIKLVHRHVPTWRFRLGQQ